MDKKAVDIVAGIGSVLFPQAFMTKKLVEIASGAIENYNTQSKTTQELREQAVRQELEERIKQSNAKILQEVAIAARIQSAEEVEMEEVYEYSGSAGGGFQANINTGDVGLNGSGEVRRVSKRIYRFKGGLQIEAIPDQHALTIVP